MLSGFDDIELEGEEDLPKFGPGRPERLIDYSAIERAAAIGCSKEEIAAVVGVSRSTLYLRMDSDPEIQAAIDRGSDRGKATLRRLQWKGANDGNATMLIWLGKQYLGQKDKSELSGPEDGPVRVQIEIVGTPLAQLSAEPQAQRIARTDGPVIDIDIVGSSR